MGIASQKQPSAMGLTLSRCRCIVGDTKHPVALGTGAASTIRRDIAFGALPHSQA